MGKHTIVHTWQVTETVTRTKKHVSNLPDELRKNGKNGARKTDKMRYQVHLVVDLGKTTEVHVPLAHYRHIDSAYKKISKLREHYKRTRRTSKVLRSYTFFIEFKSTGMVRPFELEAQHQPLDGNLISEIRYTHVNSMVYYPKGYVFMPSAHVKKVSEKQRQERNAKKRSRFH